MDRAFLAIDILIRQYLMSVACWTLHSGIGLGTLILSISNLTVLTVSSPVVYQLQYW